MAVPSAPEIIGRYQITSKLGEGAMGVVFKALDPIIGRMVAIKTVRKDSAMTGEQYEDFTRRFIQEARIAGTLAHQNIVTIYDVGQWENAPFLAMEYLEGHSLMDLLAARSAFSPSRMVHLLAQMARGLDYAHERKVVHRDIKPGNIMILPGDRVKLMDFGIAKIPGLDTTQTGIFLGSPSYTAPEQIVGSSVDHRADIFSLGIVAFEMLTGALPFPGDTITSILYSIVHKPPDFPDHRPRIDTLDNRWQAVFNIVLDKNPDRRFQRAEAFLDALGESILGRRPDTAHPPATATTEISLPSAPSALLVDTVRDDSGQHRKPVIPPEDTFRGLEEVPDSAGAMDLLYRPMVPGEASGEHQAGAEAGRRQRRVSYLRVTLTLLALLALLLAGTAAALQFGFGRPQALCLLEACSAAEAGENAVTPLLADWLGDPLRRPSSHLVRLVSEPPGAAIHFDTEETGQMTPAKMILPFAPDGRNLLTLTLEGYLPAHVQFAIGEAPPGEITLALEPDRDELEVVSTPPGATVSVDGTAVEGKTPLKLRLDRDTLKEFLVELQGFGSTRVAAADLPADGSPLRVTLARAPGPGTLVIRSPFPVTASAGGNTLPLRNSGPGVYQVTLTAGRQSVTIRNREYFHYEKRTFEISEGGTAEYRIASPGWADVTALPGNCKIHIDGAYVDFVPIIGLPLAAGSHRARFTWPASGTTRESRFTVTSGQTVKVFLSRD
jgi:serine/threonine-protein kinase